MLKIEENPPVVSPWVRSLTDIEGCWWVAHTKARCEKAFAWDLLNRHVGCFLPLIERVKISGGRKRRVMSPLFSSYVFFCGTDKDRYTALATNRLCQTIEVSDQARLIRELSIIEQALAGHAPLDPYPFAVVGQSCRVKAGPFMGFEGVVVQGTQLARLILQVSILGQGASLEIDADLLEPIE